MSRTDFHAVLFDLDGVLVDSENIAAAVWVKLLAEHGLHFSEAQFKARAVGSTHRDLFGWLKREFGWQRPADFEQALDDRLMLAFETTPAIEGAHATLQALQAAGVPFAVASNSLRSRLHRKLQASDLAGLIGAHAYDPAHVQGRGKPAPDLYQFAARQLGVDIKDCLVVEDAVPGATAGLQAGATVWGLLAGGHIHPDNARTLLEIGVARVLASHAELREALGVT